MMPSTCRSSIILTAAFSIGWTGSVNVAMRCYVLFSSNRNNASAKTGTDSFREYPKLYSRAINLFLAKPGAGAEAVAYLATSPAVAQASGAYFNKTTQTPLPAMVHDKDRVAEIWDYTAAEIEQASA